MHRYGWKMFATKVTNQRIGDSMSRTVKMEISTYAKITPDVRRYLVEARQLAMRNTIEARAPECGDFGFIAKALDFVCNELEIKNEQDNERNC